MRFLTAFLLTLLTATPAFSDLYNTAGNGGTATNDNACTGCVGEFISSFVPGPSAVALTTNVQFNVTSISLTPGDWDVWVLAYFAGGATTTMNYATASISTTSAVVQGPPNHIINWYSGGTPFGTISDVSEVVGQIRVSLATTTTYYFVVQAGFGTSTCSAYGGIYARRRR